MICVQVPDVPPANDRSQTSLPAGFVPVPSSPYTTIIRWSGASQTARTPLRAVGAVPLGVSWVQTPFTAGALVPAANCNSHTWFSCVLDASNPPNTTIRLLVTSKAAAWPWRPVGPEPGVSVLQEPLIPVAPDRSSA